MERITRTSGLSVLAGPAIADQGSIYEETQRELASRSPLLAPAMVEPVLRQCYTLPIQALGSNFPGGER
jgi:hypothetical protein